MTPRGAGASGRSGGPCRPAAILLELVCQRSKAIKNSSRGGEVFQLTTLISPRRIGVGVGTASADYPSCGPVAGLRRAVPSTALDKSAGLFCWYDVSVWP